MTNEEKTKSEDFLNIDKQPILTAMNDSKNGSTFNEIADYIEKKL